MAQLIFISPYLKGGEDKQKFSHRTKYIATREGVELLQAERGEEPATEKQKNFILRLLKSFPQAMELGEYEDYVKDQTKDAAAELIDRVWEQFIASMDERENYLDYVSHRPSVQSDGDHGLWDKNGKVLYYYLIKQFKYVKNYGIMYLGDRNGIKIQIQQRRDSKNRKRKKGE